MAIVVSCGREPVTTANAPCAGHFPPLGFINADLLPIQQPKGADVEFDREHSPYHLLVRVLRWPDLHPVDLDPPTQSLFVAGAGGAPLHTSLGEYLFSPISIAITKVSLREVLDPTQDTNAAGGLPVARRQSRVLADRNPVPMARDAVTVCELVWIDSAHLDQPLEGKGRVYDATHATPVPGALVQCSGFVERTDSEGRFAFEVPITLSALFQTVVTGDGYEVQTISPRSLTTTWIRHWKDTGDWIFTLRNKADLREPSLIRTDLLRQQEAKDGR